MLSAPALTLLQATSAPATPDAVAALFPATEVSELETGEGRSSHAKGECAGFTVKRCKARGMSGHSCAQEEEEMDELLLLDEEMLDAAPEDLPRRLLTNFAVYNAEVGAAISS